MQAKLNREISTAELKQFTIFCNNNENCEEEHKIELSTEPVESTPESIEDFTMMNDKEIETDSDEDGDRIQQNRSSKKHGHKKTYIQSQTQ